MKPLAVAAAAVLIAVSQARAHDVGTTPITWNREIARIVFDKCASCHRPGGTAFSMLTYLDVQPRANEIKDAVLRRRMPPWGAVKGFGEFRNDASLAPEQIELIRRWVDGGISRGNNPRVLPEIPRFVPAAPPPALPSTSLLVSGVMTLSRPVTLDGVQLRQVAAGASFRVVAQRPDGRVEPLLWLHEYNPAYPHPFLYRRPLMLPAGTVIRGVPPAAVVALIPVS